ncbi:MAG: hypothetical protein OMM_00959 [Candidatus Magnetoglobus multicellularis str. Araruama]|uniref:LamG-like jellyroll fold domain-containing protein n=1 Tax=Candidatus Magnetoglobus multicellularis str. Araruama TaxID=890399 RepID=A0A1V1PEV1_9BACT|nr:MAG: hypothetical protein OMM_00959 [Candidatus Magnetoglobus multicellularis str. Araruama]
MGRTLGRKQMNSFFKGNQLYRQDSGGNYRKVNDIIPTNHWKLQEESGTDVNDSGNNPITLTNSNAIVNQTGKIGKAYSFNGANSSLSSSNSLNQTSSGSFSAWIKLDTISADVHLILSQYNGGSSDYMRFYEYDGNLRVNFRKDGVFEGNCQAEYGLSADTWYFVVVSGDGSEYKMYINGVEQTLTDIDGSLVNSGNWLDSIDSGMETYIGSFGNASGFFQGYIEDVRAYGHSLSEQEIATIYNAGNGTLNSSLIKAYPTSKAPISHWKLQEESGGTANDSMNNPPLTNTFVTTNQVGKIGKAYSFNGSSSKCSANLPSIMQASSVGSFTVWANFGDTAENTEAILSVSKATNNTRLAIRRSSTTETIEVLCQINDTYQWIIRANYSLTNAGWLHFALTQDGTAPKLYINGIDITSFDLETNKTVWIDNSAFEKLSLGCTNANGSEYGYFAGLIEDVRYYDYALSEQEIKNIYNNNKGLLLS